MKGTGSDRTVAGTVAPATIAKPTQGAAGPADIAAALGGIRKAPFVPARATGGPRALPRPWLLDLFCGGGGAAMGYYRAGFDVLGVDIRPQPDYPFAFVRADALEFVAQYGALFDAIHASPPCQRYTAIRLRSRAGHWDSVPPTRAALERTGRPWIIENVVGAPLEQPVRLCGRMFGLGVYRHRLFESSVMLGAPIHPKHTARVAPLGRRPQPGQLHSVVGGVPDIDGARRAMGIDWLTAPELKEAIPPAYTEFLGRQLLAAVLLNPSVKDPVHVQLELSAGRAPRLLSFHAERRTRREQIGTGYTSVRITTHTRELLERAAREYPRRSVDELIAELVAIACRNESGAATTSAAARAADACT